MSREDELSKALRGLATAVRHMSKERPILDECWYALEITERVLEGDTLAEAYEKFLDDSPSPRSVLDSELAK